MIVVTSSIVDINLDLFLSVLFNEALNCCDDMASAKDEWDWNTGEIILMGKTEVLEKILSQYHIEHHKSHVD
jgi:predicted metal-dependent HD superfamily phosphohydrolase